MSIEKVWVAIPPRLFSADGKKHGEAPLFNAKGFKVGMFVYLSSNTLPTPKYFRIKRVIGNSVFLGPVTGNIGSRSDISDYLLADTATIWSDEQDKTGVPAEERDFATFEHEPVNARRVIGVDELGNPWSTENPLPTTATISGDVTIGTDGFDISNPDSMLATGSEDGTKTGIKHALKVGSDLKLEVKDVTANTILSFISNQLANDTIKVDDDAAQTILNNILTQLSAGGIIIGTEDGTPTGTQHVFVNNLKSMILASKDRVRNVTYLDSASRKNRRVEKFEFSSATFPGITLNRNFTYSLIGNEYVFINDNWTLI